MAVVNYTTDTPSAQQGMYVANWSGLTGGDTGQPMAYSNLADKTVQVFGTIGAPITIEGSNDPRVVTDYANNTSAAAWETLTDMFGAALSFSIHGMALIAAAPRYIRPKCAAGTTNATVIIIANAS